MQSEIENLVEEFEARRLTRRELVASLTALFSGAAAAATSASAPSEPAAQGRSLNHVSLAVSDVARSAEFYSGLLGLEVVSRPGNGGINLGLGTSFLGLYRIADPGRAHHFCVGVEDYDPERIAERLRQRGIEGTIDGSPVNRTSGGDQLYFHDPDGTLVQLSANGYQG
jgi:catechol 2,3-dioxygenase-like lactoylglutathione lyase family enzyme